MSVKDITVIITSFRSGEKINGCLRSINSEIKVLLIENSNDLDFKKSIEQKFSNVECILTGNNFGYGKSNNIGLRKTTTKYALILNPDAILDQSAIKNFLKATKEIDQFAIMGPYIQEEKKKIKTNDSNNFIPTQVSNVKGFAMFLNLSEFKDIGFFDENFFFYFEEIDLCKRLINNGKKIYLIPDIIIHHEGGASHDESLKNEMELSRNWHWMWSTFNYHKKYKGFFISFIIILPKLSSAVIKVLIYSLIFHQKKRKIYYQRLSGIINAMIGKSSWYRPKV
ncbi:MAG: glycosyltransferase [Candidatus Pelagibacterales bacterium]|nr:MAG: glycosyltransferase [Pelagibacterales bacterium]